MTTLLLSILLPLSFILSDTSIVSDTSQLRLQQDLQKDLNRLQQASSYFISDNSNLSPTVETVAQDLQLFALVANLDLSQATYVQQQQGPHQVHRWMFDAGEIRSIVQIQSNIALDTVVTQRYLENRPPTQHRIQNSFSFRTYLISTVSEPDKLYYLTEEQQGLLAYRMGEKQVEITYAAAKEGLSDILPAYKAEVQQLSAGFRQ
ncbi:hypothetical protein [Pontibacter flavimaris]|uniref:Uncharacterized protein n=1 Tax=Pontibacter flavimaris TaxID=1797110 RepID=A0A1Q5PC92_9BACT|nr:hypothetical protein [Pontibacter flavimaris]OKL39855.1 hypothetical protein A3841_15875 [Pontibacter flavimaris]